MEPIDIFILVMAVAIVIGVIVLSIIRKKQGRSIVCDCSSCAGNCAACKSRAVSGENGASDSVADASPANERSLA